MISVKPMLLKPQNKTPFTGPAAGQNQLTGQVTNKLPILAAH